VIANTATNTRKVWATIAVSITSNTHAGDSWCLKWAIQTILMTKVTTEYWRMPICLGYRRMLALLPSTARDAAYWHYTNIPASPEMLPILQQMHVGITLMSRLQQRCCILAVLPPEMLPIGITSRHHQRCYLLALLPGTTRDATYWHYFPAPPEMLPILQAKNMVWRRGSSMTPPRPSYCSAAIVYVPPPTVSNVNTVSGPRFARCTTTGVPAAVRTITPAVGQGE